MRVLNIHGFLGAPDNKNCRAMAGFLPPESILSPTLNYMANSPSQLLAQLDGMLDGPALLVGQSLGGWYADQLSRAHGWPCLLTNPCLFPPRLDIIAGSGMPAPFLDEYRRLSRTDVNPRSYILCSRDDELLTGNIALCRTVSEHVYETEGTHSGIVDLPVHLERVYRQIAF